MIHNEKENPKIWILFHCSAEREGHEEAKGTPERTEEQVNVRAIIEQNKQLIKEKGRLTEEKDVLRKRIASIDEDAKGAARVIEALNEAERKMAEKK